MGVYLVQYGTHALSARRKEPWFPSRSPLRHWRVSGEARLISSRRIHQPLSTASTRAPWTYGGRYTRRLVRGQHETPPTNSAVNMCHKTGEIFVVETLYGCTTVTYIRSCKCSTAQFEGEPQHGGLTIPGCCHMDGRYTVNSSHKEQYDLCQASKTVWHTHNE